MNDTVIRLLAGLFMIAGLASCTQPEGDRDSRPGAGIDLGPVVEWSPVDGAIEYRVQLWDGVRLLFEETREKPSLVVTPVMERSLQGVERAELQVRGIGPDGERVGPVQQRWYPVDGG